MHELEFRANTMKMSFWFLLAKEALIGGKTTEMDFIQRDAQSQAKSTFQDSYIVFQGNCAVPFDYSITSLTMVGGP